MPQNPPNITESPEFKEFVKTNNLEVMNLESISVLLYKFHINKLENINGFFEHDKRIVELEARIQKLEERLMEVAEHTRLPDYYDQEWQCFMWWRLIDKWK